MFDKEQWGVLEQFNSSENLDDLWLKMRQQLSNYGITSVFYGVTHSARKLFINGAEELMQYKTDHTIEFRDYFDDKFNLVDDITAVHCLLNESSYLWHKDSQYGYNLTQEQELEMFHNQKSESINKLTHENNKLALQLESVKPSKASY